MALLFVLSATVASKLTRRGGTGGEGCGSGSGSVNHMAMPPCRARVINMVTNICNGVIVMVLLLYRGQGNVAASCGADLVHDLEQLLYLGVSIALQGDG